MVKALALVLLVATANAAAADSIEVRAQRAEQLEATPVGIAYQDLMWPRVRQHVANLMRSCVDTTKSDDLTSFVWVANIAANGTPVDLDVSPATDIALCFSKGMKDAPFPKTPTEFSRSGMPVTLRMNLHNQPPP